MSDNPIASPASTASTPHHLTDLSPDLPDDGEQLAEHLRSCPACRQADAALTEALDPRFAELADLLSPPEPLSAAVLEAVEQAMDADFDARFAELADLLSPPASLSAAVLEAVERERVPTPLVQMPRWASLGAALVATTAVAAAVLLVVLPPGVTAGGDPGPLIEKGAGVSRPDLALKVAVSSDGALARYQADRRYTVGDVLYFRAQVTVPSEALLVRVDPQEVAVVHRQPLRADGDVDLRVGGGQPLAWTLEPGEETAAFVLLAAPTALTDADVEAALAGVTSLEAVCTRAQSALDAACAQVVVEVAP